VWSLNSGTMTFDDHVVIGHEVLVSNGCFRKDRYWLQGWCTDIRRGHVQYVYGFTGKETMVTIESITPVVVFDVVDAI